MRHFFSVLVFGLVMAITVLSVLPAATQETDERTRQVEALLKDRLDAVLVVLKNTDLAQAEKQDRIMSIIEPVIDFPLMAKLTLGRQHWSKLSADQQAEFVDLFVDRLKRSYLDKTALYSDQQVTYEQAVLEGNKVYAAMNIMTENKTVVVLYKFYSAHDAWKVYDVEVEGVSFIKSYMAQFNAILKNGTVEDLFTELKKPVTE
ncbi:Tgt2/MlaC family protein [Desulfosudis oleivorans]|uniref:Toluene tolerance family protein n=1 Tax=Desulfosudis oleivorans (strain DSM 6200 / JCM 39069 / Hxd3) TaxID=96561 RepID=A8ZUZ3_DESOH|nr:ABC transporter substrate-binding protein [Desulfosudis oleivorans]ABW68083.1 toluene tolerance family protein [Desulfosudis oleivorans Hxd3]